MVDAVMELLAGLADRVVGSCLDGVPVPDGRAEPPANPAARLTAAAHAVRDAVPAHPDGAALVAGVDLLATAVTSRARSRRSPR
ncbi:hypothetical protein ACH4ZU_09610 [Streptomyces sp. NPDC020472]|uniref:hypothetical protein n=1 Tax=Streptomyces sp. NPDC020472 TaxID=3365075 RepID=UPI0037B3BCC4